MIRLVDHRDLDRVEADQSLLHQVLEPTRARHHDVDAGSQCGHLSGLGNAAEDRRDPQLVGGRQRLQRRGYLGGQLTSGASTKPDGRDARRWCAESRLTNGIENASVFPLPVLPRPRTSRPARVSGRLSI